MFSRSSIVALGALTTISLPSVLHAQKPVPPNPASNAAWVAPSQLLAQREALQLTPQQVRELSLLSAQVRRYQQALLLAPSKPWIAPARGTTHDEASERALALLSSDQRELALRGGVAGEGEGLELADAGAPAVQAD